jgi:N-acetylglucosaminyldiphosphoundecaprenol N-acetyl-beta-D-mannosaminyltransferase
VTNLADVGHPRQLLFGLHIDAVTLTEAVGICERAITARQRLLVGVVNAAKVVKLNADRSLRESLLECDLVLADGQSVVWASRFLGRPLPERVAGIDLFESLLDLANHQRHRIYLLGATPQVLATLEEVMQGRWPEVRVAGSRDGYFKAERAAEIAADIASSGADMLFLGMGTPAKELFLARYADQLGVPIMHGVGGSFDVLAGVTRRAPHRWQRWGMEWAYRLLQEPRRLWRRYLVTNTAFLVLLLGERIRQRPAYTVDTHRTGSKRR